MRAGGKSNRSSMKAMFRLISSRLKDGAPLIFYFTIVSIAMTGGSVSSGARYGSS
jgi:hypothetical protein